ncbi:MAG TPA: malto-oligosyltrehalose trehalohydrolase [Terriglobales bacterium]|nr:malto-oligosyltrehalose trehalohydrolase [Terriglobales bacterium]
MKRNHHMPFGAQYHPGEGVRFRLWAPKTDKVTLHLIDADRETVFTMNKAGDGWLQLVTDRARAGSRYQYEIDGTVKVPDPASRFQPADVHGPSEVIDPNEFEWEDGDWRGRPWNEAVIYELHVGAFSAEGTFAGVEKRLDYLADLGVTAVELMPVSDFPGGRNWGYDGVLPFAPDSNYGRPSDLKRLVQAAHKKGLMMFLDVVYNHFGPEGNYLRAYSPELFTDRHHTPWGEAVNFDQPGSRVVRDYFIHNALYWLREYHFDGLRFDAVDQIVDTSRPHILTEIAQTVGEQITDRPVHLVLENDDNAAHYLRPERHLYNAQWNDDIHHALHVSLTGELDGYYSDYADAPVHRTARCLTEGFDYQGEASAFRDGSHRGEPSADLPPTCFVSFLQNHDQIGNRAFGERISKLADKCAVKAAMTVLLLAPSPPLLFMGEEFAAETPFLFFCDFGEDLAAAVTNGRRNEFSRFARFSDPELRAQIPDPNAPETFLKSKLDWNSLTAPEHKSWLNFYRTLLTLRKQKIAPHLQGMTRNKAALQMISDRALSAAWTLKDGAQLTLLANLASHPQAHSARPSGSLLYATPERTTEQFGASLLAWSAAWFLKE